MSKGVDVPIDELVGVFDSELWISNNCQFYGRIFRNEIINQQTGQKIIVPEYYIENSDDYRDVLLDDSKDAIGFFDVVADNSIIPTVADVRVCFAVNLQKLYPAIGTRATEYAHESVYNILKGSIALFDTASKLIRGADAFSDYGQSDATKHNMSPYYLFRFDVKLEYKLFNC